MTGWERWSIGNVQGTKIWPYTQMVHTQTRNCRKTQRILRKFEIQTCPSIRTRRPDQVVINKMKHKSQLVDVAVPRDHNVRIKESEKLEKYLDLARNAQKFCMTVSVVLIIVRALGKIIKNQEKSVKELEMKGRIETVQTTALLTSARILRRVLKSGGDLLSLGQLCEKLQLKLVWKKKNSLRT